MGERSARLLVALVLGPVLGACGGEPPTGAPDAGGADAASEADAGAEGDASPVADAGPDPSEVLFPVDRVLEVEITLDPADWERLRNEPERLGMPHATCGDPAVPSPYNTYPGTISIDGVVTANVGVRKKGNLGSISSERPGLKIDAAETVDGQRIAGLRHLTLNNNGQDPSRISQCLGYGLFAQAGVPASRCAFAHVTVDGEDLGVYSHVESIKPSFLARHFADDSGRLYESGGDFVLGATDGFSPKTDEDSPDCSDLQRVVTALEAPDDEVVGALGAVVDLDEFTTFWAMEVLTDHWDGWANNLNNTFLYHDPTSDQFHFIPWGIDALFSGRLRTTRPSSVFACGRLPWRLYDVPETRDRYLARLRELLGTVWDEAAILAEIDRMEALIAPIAEPASEGERTQAIDRTREFVRTRADVLLAELDAGTPVWPYPAGEQSCRVRLGTVTATFETSWDTLDVWDAGTGSMDGTIGGVSVATSTAYTAAGPGDGTTAMLRVAGALDDGRFAILFIQIQDAADVTPGSLPIDLVGVAAVLTFYDPSTETTSGGGLLLGGTLTFGEAGREGGAAVVGSITGEVIEL